jgi:major membrane immunogen (membrane-anchored lipoprotein)
MNRFYNLSIFLLVTLLTSCSSSDDEYNYEDYPIEGQTEEGFEDGTYCAEVEYYNPNTGTNSTYTLSSSTSANKKLD